ncbi:MAG: ABC transporter permease, partial [Anaerolineaceae bacterium]|nr:ABC transporter permease [Anaerolineaceae bacterium]
TTLKTAGQLKYDIFSSDGSTGGKTTLIVPTRIFTGITGISSYHMISVQLGTDASDETVKQIADLLDEDTIFRDERDANNRGTYLAFLFCTYAFLGVIGLVAVLNIVNSTSMRVSAGIRRYGTMRAVGMAESQLIRMIGSEALTYGITGGILGLVLGLPFSRWLYGFLVTSHFPYAHWTFPTLQVIIIFVFLGISVWMGVMIPMKQMRKLSVVEMIRAL